MKLQLFVKIVDTEKSRKSFLVVTSNIHYVATCNWLGKRGKKMGCLRNKFRVSCCHHHPTTNLRKIKVEFFGKRNFQKIYVSNELKYNEKKCKKCFKISPKRIYQHGGHFEFLKSP
jgi:hypothetical protein